MKRQILFDKTVDKLNKLSNQQLQEVNDFAEFLLCKIDDDITLKNIQELSSQSNTFDFLNEDEEIYGEDDLKIHF
jgi:hypothetical protein